MSRRYISVEALRVLEQLNEDLRQRATDLGLSEEEAQGGRITAEAELAAVLERLHDSSTRFGSAESDPTIVELRELGYEALADDLDMRLTESDEEVAEVVARMRASGARLRRAPEAPTPPVQSPAPDALQHLRAAGIRLRPPREAA